MHWRVPLRRAMGRSRLDTGGGKEGGGDSVVGTVESGEEGRAGSDMPGRDAEEDDTSGKGIGTIVGGSITVVADTEGERDGEEISPD